MQQPPLHPFDFGVSPAAARGEAPGSAGIFDFDDVARAAIKAVHHRDAHRCRCCGFRSVKHQQVMLLDGNPRDLDGMITTCVFCQQCFRLDSVAARRSGVLIFFPEVDQITLHHVARELYCARLLQGSVSARARRVLDRLLAKEDSKRAEARSRFESDDPADLARRLADSPEAARRELEEGLRLFPLDRRIVREGDLEFNQFPQILAHWRSKDGPVGRQNDFPWLDRMEKILFGSTPPPLEDRPPTPVPPAEAGGEEGADGQEGVPHYVLAAKLLRDAATFFTTLASQNPKVEAEMTENAEVFRKMAGILETEPTGSVPEGSSHAELAAKLLRDAADFFRKLAGQNPPIREQMEENANVFLQLADLVEKDPEGKLA